MVDPSIQARAAHSIWFETLGEHGFPTFFVWVGILVAGVVYSIHIVRMTRDRPDLRWARDLARMAQVSIVAYCAGGSFLSLSYWDLLWTLLVIVAATRAIVVQAIASEARAAADVPSMGWRMRGLTAAGPRPAAAARGTIAI
jgi:hypothetical protein